jgi:hypothetical protein
MEAWRVEIGDEVERLRLLVYRENAVRWEDGMKEKVERVRAARRWASARSVWVECQCLKKGWTIG